MEKTEIKDTKMTDRQVEIEKAKLPLGNAIRGLVAPTAQAMWAGGIKNLSMSDKGLFVVQLTTGEVIEGELFE